MVVFLVVLGLSGCSGVERDEVVGTWELSPEDKTQLPSDLQALRPMLYLEPDGSVRSVDIPVIRLPPASPFAREVVPMTATGTWRLIRRNGQLRLATVMDGTYGLEFRVHKEFGKVSLLYELTDPDNRPLTYRRLGNTAIDVESGQ